MREKANRSRPIKAMALLLILVCSVFSSSTAVFASNHQDVVKISLRAQSIVQVLAQRDYTDPQQIQRLLDLRPVQQIPVGHPVTGGVGIQMVIDYGAGKKQESWYFTSAYAGRGDTDAPAWYASSEQLYTLLAHLAGWNPDLYSGQETYKGETVTGFYSLDGMNYSYVTAYGEGILKKLESIPPSSSGAGKTGFLVFTEKGRYVWYHTAATGKELVEAAQYNNQLERLPSGRRAQWLVYMNPDKIERITFGAMGGGEYTIGSAKDLFQIGVDTTDRETIRRVSDYLKGITVLPGGTLLDGLTDPILPLGLYTMTISFKNGVVYSIMGSGDDLTIGTTDLNKSIYYKTPENEMNRLRDFMSLLPDATLTPYVQ